MGIFRRRLPANEHFSSLDLRMYLHKVGQQVSSRDYSGLKEFVEGFSGEIPLKIKDLRVYKNYCKFREASKEIFGSITKTLDVFRTASQGDETARAKTLEFISYLEGQLKQAA